MPTFKTNAEWRALQLLCIAFLCWAFYSPAHSQQPDDSSWWDNTKETLHDITEHGEWDVYLSGYSHHSRSTYEERRIRKLNEKAWGGGFGKTIRNAKGNDESLYGLVIRDSRENLQWSVGYAYQWVYPLFGSRFEAGAGISAMLIRREDWFDGVPFPALLPVASLGIKEAKLMATYVPRMSTRKGKGNVLLLFTKFQF
ncbi:lipid IV(A) palmitoyltransferase PagP [Noviherbaspirillum agri]